MNWITHTPGDPMPCHENTKILVLLSTGFTSKTPMKAKQWLWSKCGDTSVVGWQYADFKPTETKTGTPV